MKETLRQSMAWLHTWSGLLLGWLIFAMFLTGTASYFRPEITRWMQPETGQPAALAVAAATAQAHLTRVAPDARSWHIGLPDERQSVMRVSWQPQPKPGEKEVRGRRGRGGGRGMSADLDPGTGAVVAPRDTRGGDFFFRVHYQMHYIPVQYGEWLAGAAAMLMLAAIVSGVITHKRIFADFFTFRPKKAAQRAWLDAHNLTAVLALPFHLMITYTGLVCLMPALMPWGIKTNFPSERAYYAAMFPRYEMPARTGQAAPLMPIPQVIAKAQAVWGGGRPKMIMVENPGDSAARVSVVRHSGDQLAHDGGLLLFDGVSGALLAEPPRHGPAVVTNHVLFGLHMGRFSAPVLRWLYFLSSLAGCAMVATGLVLWTVKRRKNLPDPACPHFGFRLVERLNIGTIAGVPAGMAAVLWANRLLPVGMEGRAAWEVHSFFITWPFMILYACLRPARRAWVEGLALAATMIAALPIVSAITAPNRSLVRSLINGDAAMVAFDLTLLALGAGLAFCAYKAGAYQPAARPVRRRAVHAAAGV
ncbi:PepSY-associated TM helix domain-containing protein [Sphingomonas sp. ac-8]|uniref:PepSY-associated TM helix domain-containing protein n=1 Tax=Sphingomonas sp. ac-8 TaxID=3242977 RepID=UPI003A80F0AF